MSLAQRGTLLCWVPVCLALGIGTYFALRFEPSPPQLAALGSLALALAVVAARASEALSPVFMAVALVVLGVLLASWRAHDVAEPVLGWRYYGPVEGRVIAIDRSQSDAARLTLDQVRLSRVSPARTPTRVRISLHGNAAGSIVPVPGLRVMTTAHLSPPSGPVEPGGFDFQRHAWFIRLGAVGYTRTPVLGVAAASETDVDLIVFRLRMAMSARIREVLPGDLGSVAAAITTGDRSTISAETLTHLRISNLAHLLAISGLHMGLLTAVVFGALRIFLAALPFVALRFPTRSIAAIGALGAASLYLALSGGNVATQRAFIMVAVALGALIIGRRALSLRAVAVAATVVLFLRPEALLGPGFQMSFAATTALVAVFNWLRERQDFEIPKPLRPVFAVFVSSSVAGLATAPIAAAHFNAVAHYGLIANLLSVPLMGILVIPAAVAAFALAPLGAEALGLWVMGAGLRWILAVAAWVSALDGARGFVVAPQSAVLPLLAIGFFMLLLWQGRLRYAGAIVMILAGAMWFAAHRPTVLIADTGGLAGVMTPQGRALSKAKGAGFVARNWLENDGDGTHQVAAATRDHRLPLVHLSGKRAIAAFEGCDRPTIVVSTMTVSDPFPNCLIFDADKLSQTGAIALWQTSYGLRLQTARSASGDRLWTRWPQGDPPFVSGQYVRISPTNLP